MFGKKKDNSNNINNDNNDLVSAPIMVEEDDGFSDFFEDGEQSQSGMQVTGSPQNHQPINFNKPETPVDYNQGYRQEQVQEQVQEQADYNQGYQQEYTQQGQHIDQFDDSDQFEQQEQYQPVQQNIQQTDQSNQSKQDMVLYIIADKKENGLTAYFRDCNIRVSSVFDDIIEAKNAVLMQSQPTRIVIIDSGRGKFTLTKVRDEIIDMLGISDEQNKTTVFYTDSVLKVDTLRALGKAGKEIDWIQYKSTPVVAATILSYKENYIYDMEDDIEKFLPEKEVLSLKGLTYSGEKSPRMEISGFTRKAILDNIVNKQGDELQGYEINL